MKNRKSIIVIFVLLAVAFLGIGYAAVTDDVDVKGEIGATTGLLDLQITGVCLEGGGTVTVSDDKKTVTIATPEMKELGEYVLFEITVINNTDDYKAALTLEETTANSNTEYFEVSNNFTETTIEEHGTGKANTYTFQIEIALKKTVTGDNQTGTFTYTVTGTASSVSN